MWQTLVFPGPVPITTRVKTLSAHEKGLEALPRRRGMWKYLPGSVASVNRGINLRTRQRVFQRISTRVSFKELPVWFLFAGSSQPLSSANSSVVRRPEANSLCLFALYSQRNVKLIYILLLGGTLLKKGSSWDQTLNAYSGQSYTKSLRRCADVLEKIHAEWLKLAVCWRTNINIKARAALYTSFDML